MTGRVVVRSRSVLKAAPTAAGRRRERCVGTCAQAAAVGQVADRCRQSTIAWCAVRQALGCVLISMVLRVP
jgi:hypothetical protein